MKKLWNKILTGVLFALLLLVPCACGGEKSIDSMIDRTAKSLQKSFESDEKQVLEDEKHFQQAQRGVTGQRWFCRFQEEQMHMAIIWRDLSSM